MTTVPLTDLRTAMTGRALALGFSPADADLLVDHFVDAEMRGATGHGVERLRWLAGRPGLDPTPRLALESRATRAWPAMTRADRWDTPRWPPPSTPSWNTPRRGRDW